MRIAIAMPVCVQRAELMAMTLRNLERVQSSHHELAVFATVVRGNAQPIRDALRRFHCGMVREADACVSNSWNWGFDCGMQWCADRLVVLANDATLEPDTIDHLAQYVGDAGFWSGTSSSEKSSAITHGCDFTCAMTMPELWMQYGRFDENFVPAYFEDNDYVARIILAGGDLAQLHSARFEHIGSATIRQDKEMDYHVRYWWPKLKRYFALKWGVKEPLNDPADIRARYFATPYDSGRELTYWQPMEIHTC